MKRWTVMGSLLLAAWLPAFADPMYVPLECRIGTLSTSVVTAVANPRGYLDEILLQAPSRAAVTAVVTVISAPAVGTGISSTVLYTNAEMTAADVIRPRVAQDDNTGAALTSLTVRERFLCAGDPITLRIAQVSGVTGIVFKVWLKIEKK